MIFFPSKNKSGTHRKAPLRIYRARLLFWSCILSTCMRSESHYRKINEARNKTWFLENCHCKSKETYEARTLNIWKQMGNWNVKEICSWYFTMLPPPPLLLHPISELFCHPILRLCTCHQARIWQSIPRLCVLKTALPRVSLCQHPRSELFYPTDQRLHACHPERMRQTLQYLCVLEMVLPLASLPLHPRSEPSCLPSLWPCACCQVRTRQTILNLSVLETALLPAPHLRIPHPNCCVTRARDYAPAIRRDCHRKHHTCVSYKWLSHLLPRLHIPHLNCFVTGAQDYVLAIRQERDWLYPICVSSKWLSHRLSCLCIPHSNCCVTRARNYALSIGRECDWLYGIGVSLHYKHAN